MADNNISIVAPSESTVAILGGFTAVGGHSSLTSYHGMGSDQALQLQVVTADGRFLQVDTDNNADLFFAMRGGGGSTYGIVTSAIIKAFPPLTLQTAQFVWSGSLDTNFSSPNIDPSTGAITVDKEAFWSGVPQIEPPSSTIMGPAPGLFQMIGEFILPGQTLEDATAFLEPFFSTMTQLGVPLTQSNTTTITSQAYNTRRTGQGDPVGQNRFSSRLFPRTNWENPALFNATVIRKNLPYLVFADPMDVPSLLHRSRTTSSSVSPARVARCPTLPSPAAPCAAERTPAGNRPDLCTIDAPSIQIGFINPPVVPFRLLQDLEATYILIESCLCAVKRLRCANDISTVFRLSGSIALQGLVLYRLLEGMLLSPIFVFHFAERHHTQFLRAHDVFDTA
ncbi:hypothetical protein C8F04DRAFT_1389249 [Mycena alexandri]|uniref:FAD-binding PCMH-type domain-containing protein n=1 Tax=Mycena alexandri TaxID=1745969 RepID=A0AAD6TFW2_9AGAR|nr:hypothetical protein C8F04DRAFT_1389249 [Mycena alexandri]